VTLLTVDSSVWIDVFRGRDTPEVRLFHAQSDETEIVLGDLVLAELLSGARGEGHAIRIDQWLRRFPTIDMVGGRNARVAARNYRILRRLGFTIRKPNDLFIATWCIEEGATLLHRDRDFDPFEQHLGLRVLR
jgi:predicted nucleic acid-binding protein